MTPEQTSTGALNIDQMLQTLSSQPVAVTIQSPSVLPEVNLVPPVLQQEQVLQPSFSIENLVKPVSSPVAHMPESQTLRTSLVPKRVKMV
jgi:septum formation inhibitor-activating ATPase MinD